MVDIRCWTRSISFEYSECTDDEELVDTGENDDDCLVLEFDLEFEATTIPSGSIFFLLLIGEDSEMIRNF